MKLDPMIRRGFEVGEPVMVKDAQTSISVGQRSYPGLIGTGDVPSTSRRAALEKAH